MKTLTVVTRRKGGCFGLSSLVAFWLAGFSVALAATPPASPINRLYEEALAAEVQAFDDFRAVRAIDAATALNIGLEAARERVNVPGPSRELLDTSILDRANLSVGETPQQREAIRTVQGEVDDMILATRRLLEQLREEEAALEQGVDIDLDALRDQLVNQLQAASLANEDSGARAADLTGSPAEAASPPVVEARTDAQIAALAADQAARSADEAARRRDEVAPESPERPEWEARATAARTAAQKAREAATDAAQAAQRAITAARLGDRPAEQQAANDASQAAAEAVYQAILAAQAAGELPESLALAPTVEDAGTVVAWPTLSHVGHVGDPVSAAWQRFGRVAPAASASSGAPLNPKKTAAARGISSFGEPGTGWIALQTWYIVGPFANPGRQNVDVAFPPESLVDLDATYTGEGGAPVRWQFVQSHQEKVQPPRDVPYVIYYAYTEFWSDADRDLWVAVGSDDNSRIWLNDQLIWKSGYSLKIWRRNEGLRRVSFRRGMNRILYRVENGHGESAFSFLIQTSPES